MRKLMITTLVLALLVPGVDARRKKPRAGSVKNQVYVDDQYSFSMSIDKGWKYKVNYDDDNFRLILTQKSYDTPPDYLETPEYTKVPRIAVYVDTCTMGAMVLLDSLVSETYSSDQKKDILKEFEIINPSYVEEGTERDATVTRKKRTVVIDEEPAALWEGKAEYRKFVQTSADAVGGTRVYGAYGGAVVVAKKGPTVVLFHVMSEFEFFEDVMDEALSMITTLKWIDEESEEKDKG